MRNPPDLSLWQSIAPQLHGTAGEICLGACFCLVVAVTVVLLRRTLNRKMLCCPLAYLNGSAKKAGVHLHLLATGGEAEPSPPWQVCPGCAFTQPPPKPLRYGAGLARQTFRLAPLSSPARRASQGNPPVLDFPRALAVGTPSAQAAATTPPKPVICDGAVLTIRRHCARRMACTSLHVSICTDGVHEMRFGEVFGLA